MAKRDLMTPQELYQELLQYEKEAEEELEQAMFKHPRLAERKKVQAAYDRKIKHINQHKHLLWKMCIDEGRCFKFPHPYYPEDITKEISVKDIPGQVRVSRILLAEAYDEDLWWVDKCFTGIRIVHSRCSLGVRDCMNPKHWMLEETFYDIIGGRKK